MTGQVLSTASQSDVDAALLLLSKLGVTPQDLIAGMAATQTAVPTFAEFIPNVAAAASAGTLKAYGTYWNRINDLWGQRRLDEPTPLEIELLGKQLRAGRIQRRTDRGGASTEEHFVGAMRCVYRRAVANGHISEAKCPAAKVAKPRRQPVTATLSLMTGWPTSSTLPRLVVMIRSWIR